LTAIGRVSGCASRPMAEAAHQMRRPSLTLADVETQIAAAEDDRDFYRGFLERAEAAGLSLSRGQRLLQKAEALLGIRGVIEAHARSAPMSVARRAFPRRRALWTTSKKAR
jgi:hypothetical protein